MSTTALTVLREARELISTPEKWTQGAYARDTHGNPTSLYSIGAACWCPEGAIHRSSGSRNRSCGAMNALTQVVSPKAGNVVVFEWNDAPGRTHAEVLALFDKAIANLEAQS